MGSMDKLKFFFDPADAANSDNMGVYVRAGSDGDLVSSTLVSGKEGLDVNIINASIAVTAADLDIRDLTHLSDSVKIGDGVDFLAIDGSGNISVNQAGTWNVNLTDDGIADDAVDSGNPFKVGGRAQSALSAVAANDRVDLLADLYRRVYIHDAPNRASEANVLSIGLTEVALPVLAGQTRYFFRNMSDKDMYLGPTGVTTGTGFPVLRGEGISLEIGDQQAIYAICGTAAKAARYFALA